MLADERSLRRHRALADPSRARILAELVDDGPLDARELGARVDLHVNTVRVHLNALAEAGLVESETLPPEGRGRPRVAYRATDAAADEGARRYRLLAEILTALVARFGPEATEQLVEIGRGGATWSSRRRRTRRTPRRRRSSGCSSCSTTWASSRSWSRRRAGRRS